MSLHAGFMPALPQNEVVASLVQLLEDMLERAKSGEMNGLAASMTHSDGSHSYVVDGQLTLGTIGNIERLKLYLCNSVDRVAGDVG